MGNRQFTLAQLRRYDGTGDSPAYIAYKGIVYDASASFLWQEGRHQVLHSAGQDLTEALRDAPHGPELLERFPKVGVLVRG
jgi:predicted heme/steroid binding protein